MLRNKKQGHLRFMLHASCFMLLACGLWPVACGDSVFAQQEFTYDAKGKRNPFIPLVTPDGQILKVEQVEGMSGLVLEGIIYDKKGISYAIVNGEIIKAGDIAGGYQILKIEENQVIFVKDGEPLVIELKGEEP